KLADAVAEAVAAVGELFSGVKHIGYFTDMMNLAAELAKSDCKTIDAIHQLGEGLVAEEALAISVYSALKYEDDFDMALRTSVNHNGDSDSTGSITGNILGAYVGCEAIPLKYKDELELIGLITEVTDDLFGEGDWESRYVDAK
ncbi:MAG: ADP-ribosylglycohydrolase family protein, partial [Ruminococcus sp.]|nr:ADP-ribosylglycohydrolase family protein [Ruminococcus sp.]